MLGCREPERGNDDSFSEPVDELAIRGTSLSHSQTLYATFTPRKPQSLFALNGSGQFIAAVKRIGGRIAQRIEELGLTQIEVARSCGFTGQRLGNYIHNRRAPGIDDVVMLAKVLRTSTDWLLGISGQQSVDIQAVIVRLLELDGALPPPRAAAIAATAQSALELLQAFPDEGDARTRALLAAQAAWNSRPASKPN
jgi:transcriptional regulator with XRE-family HTH domain